MGVWHSGGPGFLSGGESWAARGGGWWWEEAAGRERPGEGRGRWESLVAQWPVATASFPLCLHYSEVLSFVAYNKVLSNRHGEPQRLTELLSV